MADKTAPGVMLYYDLLPCLEEFSDADLGVLFRAILQYGATSEPPTLTGNLAIAWAFIRPRIERDAAQYTEKVRKARYAAYVREEKARGRTALSYDEWTIDDTLRSLPPVCGR